MNETLTSSELVVDWALNVRLGLDEERVAAYCECYDHLPPVEVYRLPDRRPWRANLTPAGARLWQEVAEPARAWADRRPRRDRWKPNKPPRKLGQAALCLYEALRTLEVGDGQLLHDLAEFKVVAPRLAQQNPTALIGMFSQLKARAHVYLRRNPRAAQEDGPDFARIFGEGSARDVPEL